MQTGTKEYDKEEMKKNKMRKMRKDKAINDDRNQRLKGEREQTKEGGKRGRCDKCKRIPQNKS